MIIISSDPSAQFPSWMDENWQISDVDPSGSTPSAAIADVLEFQTNSLAVPDPWGTLDLNTVTPTSTTVTGVTSDGQPFHIDYQVTQLSCYMDSPMSGVRCVALGAVGGVLIGGGIGWATGSPTLGVVAAATSGSLLTKFCAPIDSARSGNATWVANDGGAGAAAAPQPMVMSA